MSGAGLTKVSVLVICGNGISFLSAAFVSQKGLRRRSEPIVRTKLLALRHYAKQSLPNSMARPDSSHLQHC